MASLTKTELIECLLQQFTLSRQLAKDLVDTFFEEIALALEHGQEVKLSGLGNFELRDKPARPGRNPKTGKYALISARRVVVFHAGQKLRNALEAAQTSDETNP